jgi:Tol biopolymer transport system component
LLYEIVTGRRASSGNSTAETLAAVVRDQLKAPGEVVTNVPRDLDKLIQRCLRKDPDRRFQHMVDLKIELQEVKEESESGQGASAVPARRRRRWRPLVGFVAAITLVVGGGLLWRSMRVEIPPPLVVPLTSTPGVETEPTFSPDGNQVAFAWQGEKQDNWDIWMIDVDAGSPRRLTSAPDNNMPTWSHDGRFVYFTSNRTGTFEVWRVPASGGPEERVTQTGGRLANESTDGKTLFFQKGLGDSSLMAMPVAGGPERKVFDCVPFWDFAIGGAGVYHVGCGTGTVPLYLLDIATGRDSLLGKLENVEGGITVSPDGKTVLYAKTVGEGSDLMMIENFR